MGRFLPVPILLLLCALTVLAAGVLPEAGLYNLAPAANMDSILFPKKNDYQPARELPTAKPAALSLQLQEKISNIHYYELKLAGGSRWLVAGQTGAPDISIAGTSSTGQGKTSSTSMSIEGKGFNAILFDANGDNVITTEERLKVEIYRKPVAGIINETVIVWTTRPYEPLRVEAAYTKADGSTYRRSLTCAVEIYAFYESVSLEGTNMKELLEALSKLMNPLCYARIYIETWFLGEVNAGGNRLLKLGLVDGNQNGSFNEAKNDYLLLDANYDGLFDWAKERKPLGKGLSGLNAEGKKTTLLPAVAPWPSRLILAPKGTTANPAELEAE